MVQWCKGVMVQFNGELTTLEYDVIITYDVPALLRLVNNRLLGPAEVLQGHRVTRKLVTIKSVTVTTMGSMVTVTRTVRTLRVITLT